MMRRPAVIFCHLFAFLGMMWIPFPYRVFPWMEDISSTIFGPVINQIKVWVMPGARAYSEISSDSSSMFVLVAILLVLAALFTPLLICLRTERWKGLDLSKLVQELGVYYLSFHLLIYGFNKVFKRQFYLPEPNLLYTPLGMMDKDILFWSTMGSSYSYSLVLGFAEVVAGLLLWHPRSRLTGLLMSLAIFIQVICINFCFDISVKLFSCFLLFVCVLALGPYRSVLQVLWSIYPKSLFRSISENMFSDGGPLRLILKGFLVLVFAAEVIYPAWQVGGINGDHMPKGDLHGAYKVVGVTDGHGQKLETTIRRLFIHRQNYLIFQDKDDRMEDYKMLITPAYIVLSDYTGKRTRLNYTFKKRDKALTLEYLRDGVLVRMEARALDWKSLPLLRNGFHWMVDYPIP